MDKLILPTKATKIEQEIAELYNLLCPISNEEYAHAEQLFWKGHYHYTTPTGIEKAICIDCGHRFVINKDDNHHTCPKCGAEREINEYQIRSNSKKLITYYRTTDVVNDWYVLRHYFVGSYVGKECITKSIDEVMQVWFTFRRGKIIRRIIAKDVATFSYDNYLLYSDMRFRRLSNLGYYNQGRYDVSCDTYPSTIIPQWAKECGWTKVDNNIGDIYQFLYSLLSARHQIKKNGYNADVERYYKMGQVFVAGYLSAHNCYMDDEVKSAIKVAHRHGIIIKDYTLFRDYINDLKYLGMDYHNPKYVAIEGEELKKEHNRLSERVRIIRERIAEEERRKKEHERLMREKEFIEKYATKMAFFANFMINNGNITIKPIMNVDDVKAEGENMKHCVFSMGYYKKDNVLLLSAVDINGNRLETIEYNMDSMKIVQHRGKCNSQTEWGNTICTMIESKKSKINKLYEKYKLAV